MASSAQNTGAAKRSIAQLRREYAAAVAAAESITTGRARRPKPTFEVEELVSDDEGAAKEGDDETLSVYASGGRGRGRGGKPARLETEIVGGYPRSDYEAMKERFEETHFYEITTDRLVEVTKEGDLLHMKHPHAEVWLDRDWRLVRDETDFENGYKPFYKLWMKDPARRCARRISRTPTVDPDEFYVPFQFAWSSAGETGEDIAVAEHQVTLFCRLVDAAGAANPDAAVPFLHNYFAHMLQQPLVLPGVALILTGPKGCGKDTLLNFIIRRLLGTALAVNYDRVDALFNTHDTGSMHRVAIKVEELSSRSIRPYAKQLRALITAETRVFNTKNGAIQHNVANYVRFMGTSNEDCPVPMYDDNQADRRFFIARMSPLLSSDTAFWEEVYDGERGLAAPSAGVAVARWLMARDLTAYNPRALPETDAHRDAFERSPLQMFVEDGWVTELTAAAWHTTKQVWEAARAFCRSAGIDPDVDLKDTVALGRALAVYVSRGAVTKTVGHARTAYYRLVVAVSSAATGTAEEGGGEQGTEATANEAGGYAAYLE